MDVKSLIVGQATGSGGSSEPSAYIKDASVSGSTLTLTKKDNTTVTFTDTDTTYSAGTNVSIDNGVISATDTVYTLPTASTSELGGVKVDGSTITINDGVISSSGGGLSLSGVQDKATISGSWSADSDDDYSYWTYNNADSLRSLLSSNTSDYYDQINRTYFKYTGDNCYVNPLILRQITTSEVNFSWGSSSYSSYIIRFQFRKNHYYQIFKINVSNMCAELKELVLNNDEWKVKLYAYNKYHIRQLSNDDVYTGDKNLAYVLGSDWEVFGPSPIYGNINYMTAVRDITHEKMYQINTDRITCPTITDGTYVLQCVVSNGVPTYSWVAQS